MAYTMFMDDDYSTLPNTLIENYREFKRIMIIIISHILPTNWKENNFKCSSKDGITDTDYDELTDWEEIDQTKVTIGENGKVIPPEFNIADLLSYTNRYRSIEYDLYYKKTTSNYNLFAQ